MSSRAQSRELVNKPRLCIEIPPLRSGRLRLAQPRGLATNPHKKRVIPSAVEGSCYQTAVFRRDPSTSVGTTPFGAVEGSRYQSSQKTCHPERSRGNPLTNRGFSPRSLHFGRDDSVWRSRGVSLPILTKNVSSRAQSRELVTKPRLCIETPPPRFGMTPLFLSASRRRANLGQHLISSAA